MDHTLLNPVYDRFVKDPLCKSLVSFSCDMRDCLIGVLNDLAGKGYVPQWINLEKIADYREQMIQKKEEF